MSTCSAPPTTSLTQFQRSNWQWPGVSIEAPFFDIISCSIVWQDFAAVVVQRGEVLWGTPIFLCPSILQKNEKWSKNRIKGGTFGDEESTNVMQFSLMSEIAFHFYFNFGMNSKNSWFANAIFYEGIKVNFQKKIGSLQQNFLLCEYRSVCSFPPNTGSIGNFCVCVGQNVLKWHNFLKIFNIWTYCQHFANMLMTCATMLFWIQQLQFQGGRYYKQWSYLTLQVQGNSSPLQFSDFHSWYRYCSSCWHSWRSIGVKLVGHIMSGCYVPCLSNLDQPLFWLFLASLGSFSVPAGLFYA